MRFEDAVSLQYRQEIWSSVVTDAQGRPACFVVNGEVKRWKKEPGRFAVPLKSGLRGFRTFTENDLYDFHLDVETAAHARVVHRMRVIISDHLSHLALEAYDAGRTPDGDRIATLSMRVLNRERSSDHDIEVFWDDLITKDEGFDGPARLDRFLTSSPRRRR